MLPNFMQPLFIRWSVKMHTFYIQACTSRSTDSEILNHNTWQHIHNVALMRRYIIPRNVTYKLTRELTDMKKAQINGAQTITKWSRIKCSPKIQTSELMNIIILINFNNLLMFLLNSPATQEVKSQRLRAITNSCAAAVAFYLLSDFRFRWRM